MFRRTAFLLLDSIKAIGSGRLLRFDPTVLLRQLASMLRNGVPLPQALGFVTEDFGGTTAARLEGLRARVVDGDAFSEALADLPERWAPDHLRAAVAAGERSGRLPEVLESLADERGRLQVLAGRLRGALLYPSIVLLVASFVVYLITWKILPVYASLYAGLGSELSGITRLFVSIVRHVPMQLVSLALMALIAYELFSVFFWRVRYVPLGLVGTAMVRHLPFARSLHQALLELRFARLLRLLLESGVPLDEAIGHCQEAVGDQRLAKQLAQAAVSIRSGERPSTALASLEFLSPTFLWFLSDAEERGDFLELTAAMAETAEQRFLEKVDLLERIAEPVTIVAIGAFVGFIIIACYSPLFEISRYAAN